jgi:hypothetical protein
VFSRSRCGGFRDVVRALRTPRPCVCTLLVADTHHPNRILGEFFRSAKLNHVPLGIYRITSIWKSYHLHSSCNLTSSIAHVRSFLTDLFKNQWNESLTAVTELYSAGISVQPLRYLVLPYNVTMPSVFQTATASTSVAIDHGQYNSRNYTSNYKYSTADRENVLAALKPVDHCHHSGVPPLIQGTSQWIIDQIRSWLSDPLALNILRVSLSHNHHQSPGVDGQVSD